QHGIRGIHGGHLLLQDQVEDDPDDLITEPKRPSSSLKHPEPAHAALAPKAVRGEGEERDKHQHSAHDIAYPDSNLTTGEQQARRRQYRRKHYGSNKQQ